MSLAVYIVAPITPDPWNNPVPNAELAKVVVIDGPVNSAADVPAYVSDEFETDTWYAVGGTGVYLQKPSE